jgi:hypothetical protein
MVKDRIVLSQETSCHKPADRPAPSQRRLAADPSSLQPQTKLGVSRLHCLHHRGFIYIMAAGGAGSSGLPAFESGSLTNKVPSPRITIEPTI